MKGRTAHGRATEEHPWQSQDETRFLVLHRADEQAHTLSPSLIAGPGGARAMLAERLMALRRALFAAHLRCNLVADGRLVHCHGRRANGLLIHVSLQPIATLIVHLRSMLQHTYTGNTCVRETDKNESSSGPRNRVRPVFDLVCSANLLPTCWRTCKLRPLPPPRALCQA